MSRLRSHGWCRTGGSSGWLRRALRSGGSTRNEENTIALPLPHPRLRHDTGGRDVVDHEDQLVIVVAVEYFDVDARLGHASRELAELSGLTLVQSLHDHIAGG